MSHQTSIYEANAIQAAEAAAKDAEVLATCLRRLASDSHETLAEYYSEYRYRIEQGETPEVARALLIAHFAQADADAVIKAARRARAAAIAAAREAGATFRSIGSATGTTAQYTQRITKETSN